MEKEDNNIAQSLNLQMGEILLPLLKKKKDFFCVNEEKENFY